MENISKKKEVLLSKKERLLKELRDLDATIENVMEEEWKIQGDVIVKNIDSILELVPYHDDGTVDEGHDAPDCLRCVLLAAKGLEKWPYKEWGLSIKLEERTTSEQKVVSIEKPVEVAKKKVGRPSKTEVRLSESQKKALELGLIDKDGTPKKRVLEINEDSVDLPEEWK